MFYILHLIKNLSERVWKQNKSKNQKELCLCCLFAFCFGQLQCHGQRHRHGQTEVCLESPLLLREIKVFSFALFVVWSLCSLLVSWLVRCCLFVCRPLRCLHLHGGQPEIKLSIRVKLENSKLNATFSSSLHVQLQKSFTLILQALDMYNTSYPGKCGGNCRLVLVTTAPCCKLLVGSCKLHAACCTLLVIVCQPSIWLN